jgi:RNA polymerase sigma-70 factor (ECF subfamily)
MTTSEYNKCVDEHADGLYRFILKNIKDERKLVM